MFRHGDQEEDSKEAKESHQKEEDRPCQKEKLFDAKDHQENHRGEVGRRRGRRNHAHRDGQDRKEVSLQAFDLPARSQRVLLEYSVQTFELDVHHIREDQRTFHLGL